MKRLILLAALALLVLSPQANASALIANCTLKSATFVKTMPAPGDAHLLSGPSDKEIAVDVYDEHGGKWAFVEASDKADEVTGWVLRSSLHKCQNIKPWKTK